MKSSATLIINRPIDVVFAYCQNIENMDQWVTNVSEPRWLSAERGVGATYTSLYVYARQTHTITYQITELEPPHRMAIKSLEGPFPFNGLIEFRPAEGGTEVINTMDAEADNVFTSLMFTLMGPLMRWSMRRHLLKELKTLKTRLETGG